MITSKDLSERFKYKLLNPTAIFKEQLNLVKETTGGKHVVIDANTPFTFLLAQGATLAAETIQEVRTATSQLYPEHAQSYDDLYRHMRNEDNLSRFAKPASTSFVIQFSEDEFKAKAIATPGASGKRLTIPRNTRFLVGEVPFTLEYPIEIKLLQHGGLQIAYNTDIDSTLSVVENLTADWRRVVMVNNEEVVYVEIKVPVKQFNISKRVESISAAIGYSKELAFTDQFQHLRILYRHGKTGLMTEMVTTHNDSIYDPFIPTAILSVRDRSVKVTIPPVYIDQGLVNNQIEVYLYTTKGPMTLDLGRLQSNVIKAEWVDEFTSFDNVYAEPLKTLQTLTVYSDDLVSGGANALSFSELRERVINGSIRSQTVPITDDQLSVYLNDRNYALTKYIDNVTNLTYLASSPLDGSGSSVPPAGVAVVSLAATIDEISLNETTYRNDTSVTITPDTLMALEDTGVRMLSKIERDEITTASIETLINLGNQRQYVYTPFYYVLDTAEDRFKVRAYHLDNPVIVNRNKLSNDTVVEVNAKDLKLIKTVNGYQLVFITRSGDVFRALDDELIQCQLSFKPSGETVSAYQVGELIGKDDKGNRYYLFNINSTFDINHLNELNVTSFSLFNRNNTPNLYTDLETQLQLTFIIFDESIDDTEGSPLNYLAADYLLPSDVTEYKVVTEELFTVRYGLALTHLWTSARTLVGNATYKTYKDDVPLTRLHDEYEIDPLTGRPRVIDGASGKELILLHPKGSVVEVDGEVQYLHRKGDYVYLNNEPVLDKDSQLLRLTDIHVVDGRYLLSTENAAVDYRIAIPDNIARRLGSDIGDIKKRLYSDTELFYRVQQTLGKVDALVDDNISLSIDSEQSIKVTLYVSDSVNSDVPLRRKMVETIEEAINQEFGKTKITVDGLTERVRQSLGLDNGSVKGIKVEGLGGDLKLSTVTIKDNGQRLTLAKRLVATAESTIDVETALSVVFSKHGE